MDYRTILKATFTVIFGFLLLASGCGGPARRPDTPPAEGMADLSPMQYTIQVGAFSKIDNAVRLTASLERQGLDAYHFLHSSGLYKVRFENFSTKQAGALSMRFTSSNRRNMRPQRITRMEMPASEKKLSGPPDAMSAHRIGGAENPP